MAARKSGAKPEPKFEELVQQVEQTLEQLEGGELPLEEALKQYEHGVAALRQCFGILKQAEKRVQILNDRDGEITSEDFGVDEEDDAGENGEGKLF
jgi:exodeoxyribonuclease VII small subunit